MTESQNKTRRWNKIPTVLTLAWGMSVATMMTALVAYANSPGPSDQVPNAWPEGSRIVHSPGHSTLLIFAHPKCPCTRATIAELSRLAADRGPDFRAEVWFTKPSGTAPDWAQTDLWRSAAAIPGVTVHEDDGGSEARRFHAMTSGEALLYDGAGHLLFHGGITLSRGHEGNNPGRTAISEFLKSGTASQTQTPTFGCPILENECRPTGTHDSSTESAK